MRGLWGEFAQTEQRIAPVDALDRFPKLAHGGLDGLCRLGRDDKGGQDLSWVQGVSQNLCSCGTYALHSSTYFGSKQNGLLCVAQQCTCAHLNKTVEFDATGAL